MDYLHMESILGSYIYRFHGYIWCSDTAKLLEHKVESGNGGHQPM